MEMLGSKWKLPIIWYLAAADDKTLRYNELQRRVKGVTTTMLSKCLKELERDKIISRRQYNTIPPTVEYSLTTAGMSLLPALDALNDWATEQMHV
ncbi:MAG: helix-turn-helix transcriptional regulator [Selenomonadaceae bacterium]|nr:helix-turn-helix transcriptional regulator [Selenomonadaceae bacterium]